ncbi:MAG: redoxin domain-containing protein [Herpetosiphon sp.]
MLALAFATLSDHARRYDYDRSVGLVGIDQDRVGVSNKEVIWTIMGVLVGLLVLSLAYNLSGAQFKKPQVDRFTTVNYPAKPIVLRTLDGTTIDLAQLRGRVVIVNFWGTWCEPCKQETPALEAAYRSMHDQGLDIIGVDMFHDERAAYNRTEQDVKTFAQRYGVSYPIALDDDGTSTRDYQLYNIPVSFVIDREGNVRYIRTGPLTVDDVRRVFQQLKHPSGI